MNIKKAQKMNVFSPAIFGDLKKAAMKEREKGKQVIDLSLGSPDLPPVDMIREKLSEASLQESMYGYTLGGIERFNQAVADYYKRRSNVELDPQTEVLQTMGSQEGLVHLPLAFCDERDIVLSTNPAYVAYDQGIKLAGATPYYLPLLKENNYLPDLQAIPEKIAEQAKLLILNLPGNPVPAMPTLEYFQEVVEFAKKYKILVLHDAAYSEYYFTGTRPLSFLEVDGAKEIGMEINSLSKSFSLAGARIAYLVGNHQALQIFRELKTNLDYGIFAPIQEAAIVALDHAEDITERLRTIFSRRHQIMMEGLQAIGWDAVPSQGGMFIWAKYPYDQCDREFAFELIERAGVVTVPGTEFGTEGAGYLRIALVQDEKVLQAAVDALKRFTDLKK